MGFLTELVAKNFLKSKGFWGIAGMLLPPALNMLGKATGWNISPDDAGVVVQIGSTVWSAAMGAVALYGRWNAKGPLTVGASKVVTVQK
jgi:hypothetical protein